MSRATAGFKLATIAVIILVCGVGAVAQQAQYPNATDLPNPYRLVESWPAVPQSMNGGRWGEVTTPGRVLLWPEQESVQD